MMFSLQIICLFCTRDSFHCCFRRQVASVIPRVRTTLVLGYWVLGNIHRYWVILLLGDICCCSHTQYNTNQRAVSTIHMPVNDYFVLLVTCTLTATIVCLDTMLLLCCCLLNTIIVIIIEFWDFLWSLLCCTLVLIVVLGTGITRGQYYWILGSILGIVLTLVIPFHGQRLCVLAWLSFYGALEMCF